MNGPNLEKAALRGEPSYVWRAGQERRLRLILDAAGERAHGKALDNGCGVGLYLEHLQPLASLAAGLEFDANRAIEARKRSHAILRAAGEGLPLPTNAFDLILSHEVIEHVLDDRLAVQEMVRVLRPGGRIVLFVPNRGYPFETHGIYWGGMYRFGNIPLVNYLPDVLRNRLASHVRAYTHRNLEKLFAGLPVMVIERRIIFGAYDNIIARHPRLGKWLRASLHALERTPLQRFGLSHFWVVEKLPPASEL
ncbi:MAG: class I SAM-dependent methyltransferase [Anaerolineales bacterium]|nr:class I SAM-dependent methyltransferase [Anaerolineales bacterium]